MTDDFDGLAKLEKAVMQRLDEMETRLIAEFRKIALPPRADISTPFEERMARLKEREDAMIAELKSRQAKREAEKAMWDGASANLRETMETIARIEESQSKPGSL